MMVFIGHDNIKTSGWNTIKTEKAKREYPLAWI